MAARVKLLIPKIHSLLASVLPSLPPGTQDAAGWGGSNVSIKRCYLFGDKNAPVCINVFTVAVAVYEISKLRRVLCWALNAS